ncbi:SPOR domain-containing protein [Gracilibacillus orientalis]|uniref:SPOR domain-containing protein n=1 Tax=Gracilibacillus orientalis TaxID=334253 RepID=UPI001113A739|nr:SPOR domain-containing protein [Gracilibacillus orientalis]
MDNKKQISVQINQSKSNSSEHKSTNQATLEDYIRENHHPVMDDHQVFQRKYTPDTNGFNRSRKTSFWSKYKTFLISAITAVLIGSFLGFMMLKIFVDLDPEEVAFDQNTSNGQAVTTTSDQSDEEDSATANAQEQEDFQSKAFNFFVTQAGVFKNEDAANQLVQELKGDQIESMVWSRDDKYHVFVSVKTTHDASKQYTTNTFPSSYEMYPGKEWQTISATFSISDEEKAWLTDLEGILDQMIEDNIDETAVDQWLANEPSNTSEEIQALSAEIESIKTAEYEQSSQVILLRLLNQYENVANE